MRASTTPSRQLLAVAACGALALSLAACGASAGDGVDPATDGAAPEFDPELPVTITVGNLPPVAEAENREYFEAQVEAFMAEYPHITLEPREDAWDPQTFQAQLAGGNLPDVLSVAFTEANALAGRGQVADIAAAIELAGISEDLNPELLDLVTGSEGGIYAIPTAAQTLGLIYNRDLFAEAGLDPDLPPQTWEEVRSAAQEIVEHTDAGTGYATFATGNSGGWMLSAGIYSYGGTVVTEDASEASFNDAEAIEHLTLLQQMRWEDDTMGRNFLYTPAELVEDFASGQVGMFIGFSGLYRPSVIRNEMDPNAFGMGAMPIEGGSPAALTGGQIQIVSPTTTLEEQVAAVQWIDYFHLRKFTDSDLAVEQAQASADSGQAVTVPEYPVVSAEAYDSYFEWIEPYRNVPVENFEGYLSSFESYTLLPEPSSRAQEIYSELDSVLQRILTDESADPAAVLTDAESAVNRLLGR